MAKVRIVFKGEKIEMTVNGVKGAQCTSVTKMFDELMKQHGGQVLSDVKTAEYHEEELVLENVNR